MCNEVRSYLVKSGWVDVIQESLADPPFLAIPGGNDAVFFKQYQVVVYCAVPRADSLAYVSTAGSFRVQEQVTQHFGTQRVQSQDRDCLGCFFGQGILGLN